MMEGCVILSHAEGGGRRMCVVARVLIVVGEGKLAAPAAVVLFG